jgi:hypothetical protein
MRFDYIREISSLNYVHMESAHWHLALFGWVFLALSSLLVNTFLPEDVQMRKKFSIVFWCIQALIVLDICSLLFSGYNFISIGFDVALCLCIGYFISVFLSAYKNKEASFSGELIKIALLFLAFSFCGLLLLIPVELLFSAKRSILYYLGTQFFLHFSYNGWFAFGVMALFFRLFENRRIQLNRQKFNLFKKIMCTSVFFTYFLSIYWGYPGHYPFLGIAALAAFFQLAAVVYVRADFQKMFIELKQSKPGRLVLFLFQLALFSFIIKLLLQAVVIFPPIASIALTLRNFMIAYLHLSFLGVTSAFLIGFSILQGYIRLQTFSSRLGLVFFGLGFILTELVLLIQGVLLWMEKGFFPYYYELLFAVTVLLPLGLLLILLNNGFRTHKKI